MPLKLSSFLVLLLLLGACASQPATLQFSNYTQTLDRNCAQFINDTEQAIHSNAVVDYKQDRVLGYPYLRVNRLLASFGKDIVEKEQFDEWLRRMLQLGQEGWSLELSNLGSDQQQRLLDLASQSSTKNVTLLEALTECSERLVAKDFDEELEQKKLIDTVFVTDEYQTWKRFIGLYPVSALFFRAGINVWHKQAKKVFNTSLETLPIKGKLYSYVPSADRLNASELKSIMAAATENILSIPTLSEPDLIKLFDHHAPVFEIDTVNRNDQIGSVMLNDGYPVINTNDIRVYRYPSYTRINEHTLLQLNYMIWFPARPKTFALDLLGGHLDAIIWRVSLLPDGKAWLYDSIHACGCYHMVFPTQYAINKEIEHGFNEPLLIAPQLHTDVNSRTRIRISSRSHDIQKVFFEENRTQQIFTYRMVDSKELRSLEKENGTRQSLYKKDGIVTSTQRGERFLFWPMGIASPGAMRQPGNHATAFVGRRHFDDAKLFQPYFDFHEDRDEGYVSQ